jgi:hypothetical protein
VKTGSSGNGDVRRVSGEIATIRNELGSLVAELDRRRHEAFDLKLQARKHPVAVAVAAGGAALVLGGLIALVVRSRRNARRPSTRMRETRRAMARLLEHPDRVAAEPSIPNKILTGVAVAAGTAFAKAMIDRSMRTRRTARARPVTTSVTVVRPG